MILLVHILAGGLGLVFGYVALYAAKGATLHRKAGMLFVCAMLTMSVAGMTISAVQGVARAVNIPAALLTFYLVITALTTVRPIAGAPRWLPVGALLIASAVGLSSLMFGFEAVASSGRRNGIPAFPFFMFGVAGLLGGAGDLRVLRSGAHQGARRLARHL